MNHLNEFNKNIKNYLSSFFWFRWTDIKTKFGVYSHFFDGEADHWHYSQVADLCPRLLQQTVSVSRQLAGRRSPTSLQTPHTCRRNNQFFSLLTEDLVLRQTFIPSYSYSVTSNDHHRKIKPGRINRVIKRGKVN